MRYTWSIKPDEDLKKLSNDLEKNLAYKFSLLNFASVVADVLAENSIFSKKISGNIL